MNANETNVLQVPIEDIVPNRAQPRVIFDDDSLDELAASIKEHGIIQPLVLRRRGEKYEIVAGERRFRAAKKAGLTGVPAILTNISDDQAAEVAIVENIQRKDLTAIEEARSFKAILDKGALTQADLAQKMGVSQSAISNKLRLLSLAEDVQQAVLEGKISERHARSLLKVNRKEDQIDLLKKVINERLTVKQLENEIKKAFGDVPLIQGEINIEDIKSKARDIEQLGINDYSDTSSDDSHNKFFNSIDELEPSITVEEHSETESQEENTADDKSQSDSINVSDSLTEENSSSNPAEDSDDVEMLEDFDAQKSIYDDLVSKIKEMLTGKVYYISERDVNSQHVINIIIDN